jgi:hypothetical protein
MNGDSNYSFPNELRGLQCFGMFLAQAIAPHKKLETRSSLTPKTWNGSRPSRSRNPKQAIVYLTLTTDEVYLSLRAYPNNPAALIAMSPQAK